MNALGLPTLEHIHQVMWKTTFQAKDLCLHFMKNITISAAAQVKVVQGPKLATNLCLRGLLQIDTIQEKGQVFAAIVQD